MSEKNIIGVSYAGTPKDHTAMYISKKVDYLLENLYHVNNCIVFAETGMNIPNELLAKHRFIISDNVQAAYANYLQEIYNNRKKEEISRRYTLTEDGTYIGENVSLGENVYLEPGSLIGHDVVIGSNTIIKSKAIIKNSIIGDNCLINEMAVVGANGFTIARDEGRNLLRIPSLGRVVIGNNVEIGAQDNISVGSAGSTIIDDNVKIDALVYIAHDVHIGRNVQIAGGTSIGGYCQIGEDTFVGFNTSIKNRIKIGKAVTVGMGSVVIKDVDSNSVICGNPSRKIR